MEYYTDKRKLLGMNNVSKLVNIKTINVNKNKICPMLYVTSYYLCKLKTYRLFCFLIYLSLDQEHAVLITIVL